MGLVFVLVVLMGCGLVSSAPQFKTITPVVQLYELQGITTSLSELACEDTANTGAKFIVSLGTVSPPCDNCFQVYPNCGGGLGGSYCLQYLPVQTLNFKQNKIYSVGIVCRNEADATQTATATVEVRLRPNTPPFFTTAISVSTSRSNTENIDAGGSVYAVACSDPNNDAVEYTLTTTPSSDLFYIDTSGVIRANKNLQFACFNSVTFAVTCSDRRNTPPTGPAYIYITLNGANQQPRITGLNNNLDIREDTADGTVLGTYTVKDDDTTTCTLSTIPLDSLQYFTLDAVTKTVKVRGKLDYEQIATRNTNITVTCTDTYCTSAPSYLYVRVTDVNEQIQLIPNNFALSAYEGNIVLDPKWTPIDPDLNDVPTYTIIGGNANGRFTINPTTGIITSTIAYDVDQNAMPATDVLVVKATDKGGLTSTATVSINILDINDNRPIFTVGSQTIVVNDCTNLQGTNIGTAVTATDRDSTLDGNNVVFYSGTSGPIRVDSQGNIVVTGVLTAPSSYSVQVTASDSGTGPNKALTSSPLATITVVVQQCVTTTPAPTTAAPATTVAPTAAPTTASSVSRTNIRVVVSASDLNSADSLDENLGWIVFAGLLATVFLAALIYMLWRFCYASGGIGGVFGGGGRCTAFCNNACTDCCAPRPAPRRQVVAPVRGKPRGGNKGFWQERYPDDDYVHTPERDRTPSPAPIEGGAPLALQPQTNWRHRPIEYY